MEDRTKSPAASAAASSAGAAAALASRRAQQAQQFRPPDAKRALATSRPGAGPGAGAGAAAAAARMRQRKATPPAPPAECGSPGRGVGRPLSTVQQRPPARRINSARSTDSEHSNTSARTLTPSAAAAAAQALTPKGPQGPPMGPQGASAPLHTPQHTRAPSGDAALAASRRHSLVPAAASELPQLAEEARQQARAQARKLVSAAARASSLNPRHIEPKPALQDKLLSVFDGFAEGEKPPGRAGAANSAVAAAALARTNADSQIARVAEQIRDKQQRKARFQPAASWSTSRGLDPEPPGRTGHAHHHHHLHAHAPTTRRPSSTYERENLEKQLTPAMFLKKKMLQKLGIRKGEERETASPEPQQPQPSTMRKDKKSKFNEHKPWKHHSHAKTLTEKERRRYERLWAANRGQHVPYFAFDCVPQQSPCASSPSLQSGASTLPVGSPLMAGLPGAQGGAQGAPLAAIPSSLPRLTVTSPDLDDARSIASFRSSVLSTDSDPAEQQAEDVHGFAVANLWHRSNLPDDVLEKVWALVDHNHDGTLDRESFIVGTWLVDQCLYGRKLPTKVSDQIWTSAGRLNVKIRVKKNSKKWRHQKKITPANAAALMASRDQARSPAP